VFTVADPEDVEEGRTFKEFLNLRRWSTAGMPRRALLASAAPGPVPVHPHGYFMPTRPTRGPRLVFNRIVGLKDKYQPQRRETAEKVSR